MIEKFTIQVTAEDIEAANKNQVGVHRQCYCPVARAVKRCVPASSPRVYSEMINLRRWTARGLVVSQSYLPQDAVDFIRTFDGSHATRGIVAPTSFVLEIDTDNEFKVFP